MKRIAARSIVSASLMLHSCSNTTSTTTTINTDSTSIVSNNGPFPDESNPQAQDAPEQKTNAELALEGAGIAADVIADLKQQKQYNDSTRQANMQKLFAYQIGFKMAEEDDAYALYFQLIKAGIPAVYVFKAARREYYIVQFEAKEQKELIRSQSDFKAQLGDLGNSGISIINLNKNICPKRKALKFKTNEADGKEIKCLICE